ncbi:MAG: LPS export ABC transporter ATP-binding protein [Candidatus Bipolaricaulota bacterium]|nr:LPS export ABC transporter ATP-binding protein [Candidatus Bipolaricaulota bacterium]MCX7844039.1 LPS export ABC transporter ATP-binding protein [Candidatus Bipolaricaulota bacterium]MDW8151975.1 LPS export ABC transporter ATP-binding protein [Candidatus Bipolaricaulota bacterium]
MPAVLEGLDLVRRFGPIRAVDGLTVRFRAAEVTGLLGPNGAGKTTTLYLLAGFLRPNRGEVFLGGRRITGLPFHRRARLGIHYLPQEPSVFLRTTVAGNVKLALAGLGLRWNGQVDQVLADLGLTGLLRRRVAELSAGERRKVEVARALVTRPLFLLLDEPFLGVDPLTVQDLSRLVRQLAQNGIGVVICDHNVRDTLRLVDRAYLIQAGKLVMEGTPAEIVADARARQSYLGENFVL